MILYFTATGNSLAVAKTIAKQTGEKLFDMGTAYRKGRFEVEVDQEDTLGFVFPVYRWSTPALVDRFIQKATFASTGGERFEPSYCYYVETYGYFTGSEGSYFKRELFASQGFTLDACYQVKTNANCLYVSNPPKPEKACIVNDAALISARSIAEDVLAQKQGDFVKRNTLGRALSMATSAPVKHLSVKPFNVLVEKCKKCATCVNVCPTNTITMEGGLPTWSGDDCTECLACLHRCPQEASQYGKSSVGRRRYLNPALRVADRSS